MHNIKDIRKDIDNFKNTIKNRNVDVDFDQILNLDEENRKLIQEKEKLEMEKKSILRNLPFSAFLKSSKFFLISFKLCIRIFKFLILYKLYRKN